MVVTDSPRQPRMDSRVQGRADDGPSPPRNMYHHRPSTEKLPSPSPEIARELAVERTTRLQRRRSQRLFRDPSLASTAPAAAAVELTSPPSLPLPPIPDSSPSHRPSRPKKSVTTPTGSHQRGLYSPEDGDLLRRPSGPRKSVTTPTGSHQRGLYSREDDSPRCCPRPHRRSESPYASTELLAGRVGITRDPGWEPPAPGCPEQPVLVFQKVSPGNFAVLWSGGEPLASQKQHLPRYGFGAHSVDTSSSGALSSSLRRESLEQCPSFQKGLPCVVGVHAPPKGDRTHIPRHPVAHPQPASARGARPRQNCVTHPSPCHRSSCGAGSPSMRRSFEATSMYDVAHGCAQRRPESFSARSAPRTPRDLPERIYAMSTAGTPRAGTPRGASSRLSVTSSWTSRDGPRSRPGRRAELEGIFHVGRRGGTP